MPDDSLRIGALPCLSTKFVIRQTQRDSAPTTQVAPADSSRFALVFTNPSVVRIQISTVPTNSTAIGIVLDQQGGLYECNFRDHGALVQQAWYSNSGMLGTLFTVIEVLENPMG